MICLSICIAIVNRPVITAAFMKTIMYVIVQIGITDVYLLSLLYDATVYITSEARQRRLTTPGSRFTNMV